MLNPKSVLDASKTLVEDGHVVTPTYLPYLDPSLNFDLDWDSGKLNVQTPNERIEEFGINIMDLKGATVYQQNFSELKRNTTLKLLVGTLTKGIYIVKMNADQHEYTDKIFVL